MSDTLYWEDFRPGETVEIGRHTFGAEEIIAFARQFDPQPFHTDPEAARHTFFGGLVASGWHTCAVGMRLMVEHYIGRAASLGSPGVENIRWLAPVRPGDTLAYRRVILETRPSASRPGMGLVRSRSRLCKNAGPRFFCRSKVAVAASTGPFRLAEKSEAREIVVWRAGLSVFTQPRSEAVNQRGETVMTMEGWGLFRRRPGGAP